MAQLKKRKITIYETTAIVLTAFAVALLPFLALALNSGYIDPTQRIIDSAGCANNADTLYMYATDAVIDTQRFDCNDNNTWNDYALPAASEHWKVVELNFPNNATCEVQEGGSFNDCIVSAEYVANSLIFFTPLPSAMSPPDVQNILGTFIMSIGQILHPGLIDLLIISACLLALSILLYYVARWIVWDYTKK